jgi:hypothetical protein
VLIRVRAGKTRGQLTIWRLKSFVAVFGG